MNRLLAVAAVLAGPYPAFAQDDVYRIDKVWQLHIEMTAKEYEAMQPPPSMGGGFGFGPPMAPLKPPEKKPGQRETHRSVFGTDFPLAHATIRTEGHTANNVGIRYKGNSTYLATAHNLKRSLKIDVNQFEAGQSFLGLKTINLHSGVHDPSRVREALAYEIFRTAGVPAPRTAFAEVTLTVPGKYDKEHVGFYTFTEQVNKPFLRAHYKTDEGLLMKPERVRGLDYLGENWEAYKTTYQPKRDATREEIARVLAFIKLVNRSPNAAFEKQIPDYLDVDAFLKFLAATSLTADLDCFFTNGHNYYLYLHPVTKQFHFIPWDTDMALGNFAYFGTSDQQADLSITKPYVENRLADRLLAMPGMKTKYLAIVKELAGTALNRERVLKQVAAVEAAAKPQLTKEAVTARARREFAGQPGIGAFGSKPLDLKSFIQKRVDSVAAQLAGKSKGYEPKAVGFGPAGGGFGPPAGAGPPGGGFGPPGGFGRPGGFGPPGAQLAKSLLEAMDLNRSGKASETEFQVAMKKFFAEWDTNRDGLLDEQELAAGLQRLTPAPKRP